MKTALLWPIAGLLGWAGAFTLVYALHGVGCANEWQHVALGPTSLHRAVLAGSTLACLAALAALAAWVHRHRAPAFTRAGEPLLAQLSRASAWIGLAAGALTLFPVFTTSTCR